MRIVVPWANGSQDPISKIPNTKKGLVERLKSSKNESLSSIPTFPHKKREERRRLREQRQF
jgi:hypothetical protein